MTRPKPFAHFVGEEAAATTPFEPNDLGIAARVRAEGLDLVSGSVREFRRAAGLAAGDGRVALDEASSDD